MFKKKAFVQKTLKQCFFLLLVFPIYLFSQNDYDLALTYLKNNDFNKAALIIQNLLEKNKETRNNDDLRLIFTYSKILKEQGKIDSSYIYLERVKPLLKLNKNKDSTLLYYACKAEIARFDHNKYVLDEILKEAEIWYNKNKNYSFNNDILAYYFNRKAASFSQYHHGNKDTVNLIIALSNKVINFKHKIKDKSIVAYSLNEKAQSYNYSIDSVKGLEYYKEALKYSNDNNLYLPAADIAFNIGRYFGIRGQLNETILYYEEAYAAAEKSKNLSQLASISYHLSSTYKDLNDFKNAFKYKNIEFGATTEINKLKTSNLLRETENKLIFERQADIIKANRKEVKNTKRYLFLLLVVIILVVIGVLVLIIYFRKIKYKNKKLEQLSIENKFLLSEANHRINNNLQLIIILIEAQLKKLEINQQTELKNVLSKIDSIATLHRHLYRNKDKAKINCKEYLIEIIIKFNDLLKENNIELEFKIKTIFLQTDTAMYIGLLLTELIINSIKHAFEDQNKKKINFTFKQIEEFIFLEYTDNGTKAINTKLNPKLVSKLCRQLRIEPTIDTESGFLFTIKKEIN